MIICFNMCTRNRSGVLFSQQQNFLCKTFFSIKKKPQKTKNKKTNRNSLEILLVIEQMKYI